MTNKVCLVTGVGPGTGRALVERFASDYQVAMLARDEQRLGTVEKVVENTHAFPCDVTDQQQLAGVLDAVSTRLGPPTVVIHNAVGGARGDFLSIEPEVLQRNFDVNVMAFLHLARAVAPAMIERGEGAILATGNTAAYRGVARFAGFAPTKAAQRVLAESMARHLGPQGVHVAYVAIDAVIDLPWTRRLWPDEPDGFFCKPADIAGECWHLAHQPQSAWTFDVKIRPYGEKW